MRELVEEGRQPARIAQSSSARFSAGGCASRQAYFSSFETRLRTSTRGCGPPTQTSHLGATSNRRARRIAWPSAPLRATWWIERDGYALASSGRCAKGSGLTGDRADAVCWSAQETVRDERKRAQRGPPRATHRCESTRAARGQGLRQPAAQTGSRAGKAHHDKPPFVLVHEHLS